MEFKASFGSIIMTFDFRTKNRFNFEKVKIEQKISKKEQFYFSQKYIYAKGRRDYRMPSKVII